MIEKPVTIINKLGLHARASAKLVTHASRYQARIELVKDSAVVNSKSIMGVMMLAAAKGTALVLRIEGEDEQQAMDDLTALINDRFNEDE